MEADIHIETQFKDLIKGFDNDETFANRLWDEIKTAYSQPERHYHNLSHIRHMLGESSAIATQLAVPDVYYFSLFYHDIIYNVKKQDNEEQSAKLAVQRAIETGLGVKGIELCRQQILATKTHSFTENSDTNYLTDIDLSVLGATPEDYEHYTVAIRKEYRIYPGFLYKKGRRKVLKHFLEMRTIFKTQFFQEKYEGQAKANLRWELEKL
jgi:predicted metal-dependent HD superfamily phosphohydrolase